MSHTQIYICNLHHETQWELSKSVFLHCKKTLKRNAILKSNKPLSFKSPIALVQQKHHHLLFVSKVSIFQFLKIWSTFPLWFNFLFRASSFYTLIFYPNWITLLPYIHISKTFQYLWSIIVLINIQHFPI